MATRKMRGIYDQWTKDKEMFEKHKVDINCDAILKPHYQKKRKE